MVSYNVVAAALFMRLILGRGLGTKVEVNQSDCCNAVT